MRRIPLGRFAITGRFPSRYSPESLPYESALEGKFLAIMDSEVTLRSLATQCPTVWLTSDGKQRRYTPDVLVTWRPNVKWPFGFQRVAFEVKPFSILRDHYAELAPKLKLARKALAEQGIGLRIATNLSIETPRLANALKINARRAHKPKPEWYAAASDRYRWEAEPFAIGDLESLLVAAGAERFEARDAMWHWIGQGILHCDLRQPVKSHTRCQWWTMLVAKEFCPNEKSTRD